jgi:hypothetical protein
MSEISPMEGIKYGFEIMVYLLGVFLAGGLVLLIGAGMMGAGMPSDGFGDPNYGLIFIGFLLTMVGVLTFYAGIIGSLYKLIVDGVSRAETQQ